MSKIKKFFYKITNIKSKNNKFKFKTFFLVHKYKLLILFIFLSIISYLIFSLQSVNAVRVDLLSLKNEIDLELGCHEDCRRSRQLIKNRVAANLLVDKKLFLDYQSYFLQAAAQGSSQDRLLWQELLQMANLNENNENREELLNFFINYLILEDANPETKSDIIRYLLAQVPDLDLAEYYFMILEHELDNNLLTEAIRAISLLEPKDSFFTVNQLAILYNLLYQENIPASLKMDTLFLINNYHLYYPEESRNFLADIYYNFPDTPLQYIAAEFLHKLGESHYVPPLLSDDDWLPYF